MERPITITTYFTEYVSEYNGTYIDYNQIHIFCVPYIISTYYEVDKSTIQSVRNAATTILREIRKISSRKNRISLFEKDGKFLITESENVVDLGELLTFFPSKMCYETTEDSGDMDNMFSDRRIDQFFKDGLTTVGAPELYNVIEPHIIKKQENNDSWKADNEKLRKLNISDPKFTLKFYYIGKDYKPQLKHSFPIHSPDAHFKLPEFEKIFLSSRRMISLTIDNETGKPIESCLIEEVENVRSMDELRRQPSVIDLGALQRMELDEDDPDFLSYDDYVGDWNGDD